MSDEIDIEEHDVMDNPSIKKIFPDLTVIKKEINQYYDEAFDALPDNDLQEPSLEVVSKDSKIQPTTHLHIIDEPISSSCNTHEATDTPKKSSYLHENIIILGSKPSLGCLTSHHNGIVKRDPQLILPNVSSFLNRCKRFCETCLILFPKGNLLSLHMINVHKRNNHTSATKFKKLMGRKVGDKLYKCNSCNKTLSCKGNLIRHFKTVHGASKTIKTLNLADKHFNSDDVNNTKTSTNPGFPCFHCKLSFPSQSSLIEHLYQVLDPVTETNDSAHPKETNKNDNCVKQIDKSENIKCLTCILEFRSKEEYDNHLRDNHHEALQNSNNDYNSLKNATQNKIKKRKFSNTVVGLAEYDDENNKRKNVLDKRSNLKVARDSLRLNKKCKKCIEYFKSQAELENHIMSVHRNKTKFINKNQVKSKKQNDSIELPKTFYKCFVCSKYNVTFEFYSRHLVTDHNITEINPVKKVPFNSNCELCSSKMTSIQSYNGHLYKYHKMKLREAVFPCKERTVIKDEKYLSKDINFACKNTLFKCSKCDFFFLSSNTAMDHSKHIQMLNNWQCSECERVFKKEDKELHIEQHLFSQNFNVHILREFSRVLYKCCHCTVHYSEENMIQHYKKCDTETPNSVYCKKCDIIINKDDVDFHHYDNDKQMDCLECTIVDGDIIETKQVNTNKIKKYINNSNNVQETSKLVMNYCPTCKCFLSNGNQGARKIHIKARCGHMLKTICKDCGLILTMKTHSSSHKNIHKTSQVTLQDYLFYDLRTKKQICPPIPDYPSCNMCGVHFLRNSAIKIHSCQDQDYITCDICSIKLTEHAYKLHMSYHNYLIHKTDTELKNPVNRPTNDISSVDSQSCASDNTNTADIILLYTCKSCQTTLNTYDKVVNHCQDHYHCKNVPLDVQKCQHCNLIFKRCDYESHNVLHLKDNYNKDSIVIDFDPFYFRFNNSFWIKHIFAYVADEQISNILDTSIYKYECRIKMEELQSGLLNLVLYKCEKCLSFIDPHSLYIHAKNSYQISCDKLRKFPCAFCGLCFGSISYRIFHEKEHKCTDINLKSYKIILFNKTEHDTFNKIMFDVYNRFILYQCRGCNQVVDKFQRTIHTCDVHNLKICNTCGLLLHRQDYDLHFVRHEELDRFNGDNITVVMFGKKSNSSNMEVKTTFSGAKIDYTIYKCKKCNLCLRTKTCISNHICVLDDLKLKCPKCDLYFLKTELKNHFKLHESNCIEFDELNIDIITFDGSPVSANVALKETSVVDTEVTKESTEEANGKSLEMEISKDCLNKHEILYKCGCGLHFLEELIALQHSNTCNIKMKVSKQSCFKCDLLFTPGELFNHLLKHHCDKKIQYIFDIVLVSKKENETLKT